MQGAWKAVGN